MNQGLTGRMIIASVGLALIVGAAFAVLLIAITGLRASTELGRPATVHELMQHLFAERAWGSMAESETYAHLEHLRLSHEATSSWSDGLLCYEVTASA